MFDVYFGRQSQKFLDKSDKLLASRLFEASTDLSEEPFPHDCKRVENQFYDGEKVFRIRVGDYRVLYTVNNKKQRIIIVNIEKRARVYD